MYDCIQNDDDYENGDYNFDNNFMYHPPHQLGHVFE